MSSPSQPSVRPRILLAALALTALAVAGCRDQGLDNRPPADSGVVEPTTCARREDCAGRGICVGGVCEAVVTCMSDDQCSATGKICHRTRGYCVQCDGRDGQCAAGQTCQSDFTCVAISARDGGVGDAGSCSGTCMDRSQCSSGLVCSAGACCPPPARCTSPEQCPASRPLCNGATGECFGSDSCTGDPDCADEPGCANGACTCNRPAGSNTGTCEVRADACANDTDCRSNGNYVGKFCALTERPRACLDAPNCASDADCASRGLVCDLAFGSPSNGRCVNGTPCPNGNECAATQTCQGGVCVAKNCLNTAGFCSATETCDTTTGRCVPSMSGSCTANTDCMAGYYCDLAQNVCAVGCRDSTDCAGGVCNAQNRCENAAGGTCGMCNTDAECPGGTTCREAIPGLGSKRCYEACSSGDPCTNANSSCVIRWCSCLGV
jgi:hypothetical protein